MLHFFTDAYCEELISSMCARYHYYSLNTSTRHTLMDLFGKEKWSAFKTFPTGLSYLEKQLNNKEYTSDYFIYRHTIFPFYSPFISKSKHERVINSMKYNEATSVYTILGISVSNIDVKRGYMYCRGCINDDINKFGEAYFHRVHQLQGVIVCPNHGCVLEEYDVDTKIYSKFIRLDSKKLKIKELLVYEEEILEELLIIAKAAEFILKLPYLEYSQNYIQDRFIYFLNKRNYYTHGNYVRHHKLLIDFLKHFNTKVLELLNSMIINPKVNWIREITRNSDIVSHPIRNILLILFLTDNDIEMFFKIKIDTNPFGKGPWPCLNVAAEHYLEKVINSYELQLTYRSTVPKGIFRCICGYVYFRKGLHKHEQNMFKADKVLERGTMWKAKFIKCLEESNYNIRYTSRTMQCSREKIRKYIKNKGFVESEYRRVETDLFIEYSNKIINFIDTTSNCTRSDIYKNLRFEVRWIRINNPEWIEENFPTSRRYLGAPKNKSYYTEQDLIRLDLIKKAYNEIILLEKPKRITVGIIERYSKLKIARHIKKLPRTKQYIDGIVETRDDFRLRRVKKYCDKLVGNNINLSINEIFRRTSIIRNEVSDSLLQQINKIVDDYRITINGI